MPPTLSYPGVYIVEKASGVRTITGVATSITAFLGRASRGPIDKPVRCLSLADFVRTFGPPHPESELAASVSLFFGNGGTDCYVVRLAKNSSKAAATLRNYAGRNALIVRAKEAGRWGNSVRLEVDYNTSNPEESFNLRVSNTDASGAVTTELHTGVVMDPASSRFAPSFVTESSNLIEMAVDTTAAGLGDPAATGSFYNTLVNSFAGFSLSRRGLGPVAAAGTALKALVDGGSASFEISVDDSSYLPVTIPVYAAAPAAAAAIVTPIETAINAQLNLNTDAPHPQVTVSLVNVASLGHILRIDAANGRQSSVRIRPAGSGDITAALMFGVVQGGIEATRWSNFRPAATGSMLRLVDNAGSVAALDTLAAIKQNAMANFTLDGTAVAVNVAPNSIVTTAGTDRWVTDATPGAPANKNLDGVREKLKIIANAVNADNNLPYRAEQYGYCLVLLPKTGDLNVRPVIAGGNAAFTTPLIVNVRQYPLGDAGPAAPLFSIGTVGSDGIAPDFNAYVGDPVAHTGFFALDTVDLFNLLVLPADVAVSPVIRKALWGPASNYCRSRRAFLLIEAPDDWTSAGLPSVIQNQNEINKLRQSVDKEHSAVFYPKIRYRDGTRLKDMGVTGALAGLFARTDASRGVWKAPAGTEADLRGIAGLNVTLTDLENGVLNKLGVNCIRTFPVGYVNWGARTMAGLDDLGSEWKYIPIRRLTLFLEETLFRSTQWVVFEPNDEPLWANVRLNVRAFMNGLFRQGAFQGGTPDQAFYVKCDGETTTQNDRNLGIVNIEVGFAPLKPAEFVVITIQQMAGDLE